MLNVHEYSVNRPRLNFSISLVFGGCSELYSVVMSGCVLHTSCSSSLLSVMYQFSHVLGLQ